MLKYLNSFQNNKDLLLLALETNPRAIQFADKKLLKDEEIALKVLNIDFKYFDYLLPYMNESYIRRALVKYKHG